MAKSTRPDHFVVDGSNIATEGRSAPSLEQLNEAVLAFMDEHPDAVVTVVVDATFGHRIEKKEVKAFDEAVANNELVTPPAGAVGRGDAFVLTIADKARAGVLSNDSFQEFHGEYDWLFDDGRLIGGKPVPYVGWVFVERTPVRGPKSRRAVRGAKDETRESATGAKEQANRRVRAKASDGAAEPEATEPAESSRSRRGRGRKQAAGAPAEAPQDAQQQEVIEAAKAASPPKGQVNELMPFLEFVEHHPLGTSCTGVVESYASHGAYARVDDVLLYIPLRLMDDPAPRSARSVLSIGEAVALVIVGYVPDRRSIDAALPHMAAATEAEPVAPTHDGAAKQTPAKRAAAAAASEKQTPAKKTPAKKTPAKKTAAKKTAAKQAPAKQATAAKKTPAKKTAAKRTAAKKTPAKQTPAKKTPAKKTPAKAASASVSAETRAKQAPARKTAAKKATAKKTPARKAPAKQTSSTQDPSRTTAAKRAPAKRAPSGGQRGGG